MMTVTYLSPDLVRRQTRSSTPTTFTPSNRPRVVGQHALALGEGRIIGRVPGHPETCGDARDGEVVDHQCLQRPPHRATGSLHSPRHCSGEVLKPSARIQSTCSGARGPAAWSSGARTAHARAVAYAPHATAPCRRYPSTRDPVEQLGTHFTARSGPGRRPTSTRPSSSRQQKTARSGAAKAASSTSRSSGWAVQEPPSLEGPAPSATDTLNQPPTPTGKSQKTSTVRKTLNSPGGRFC